jgi:tRNA pseudouridine38-40 synthase
MRLRLVIAYDGSAFKGWQSQAGGGAVQDHLEAAFAKLCRRRIVVHGSGRTDSGVHALGQSAHVDVDRNEKLDWLVALNGNLPREIRVLRCARASRDFHARFSARGKIYSYRIWNAPVFSPFELHRAWHLAGPLDIDAMRMAGRDFVGRSDFKPFAANRGNPDNDTTRTIYSLAIRKKGPVVTLRFHGSGFLYKMVRLMTGALVKIGQGRAPIDSVGKYLDGTNGKCSFAAPADGLYLVRVIYGVGAASAAEAGVITIA